MKPDQPLTSLAAGFAKLMGGCGLQQYAFPSPQVAAVRCFRPASPP
jgi:hypothetical protein